MAKTKNDPKAYAKREIVAPKDKASKGTKGASDRSMCFFTAPMKDGLYLDFRPVKKIIRGA